MFKSVDKAWVVRSALSLATMTIYLEALTVLMLIGGTITGILLALHRDTSQSGATIHPLLGVGVGSIVGSIMFGILYVVIFRAVRLYAVDKAFQYR